MRRHPRITPPSPYLPPDVREVLLAPAHGGYTAFVWRSAAGGSLKSIPLTGCHPECEASLRKILHEKHGFEPDGASAVARFLFRDVTLGAPGSDPPEPS